MIYPKVLIKMFCRVQLETLIVRFTLHSGLREAIISVSCRAFSNEAEDLGAALAEKTAVRLRVMIARSVVVTPTE